MDENNQPHQGPDQSPPPTTPEPTPEAPPATPSKSLGKILLIEDDLPMVKMYSTKLQAEGFEVEVALDGEEGWLKSQTEGIDLVLLDLMIPKMGGMELLEKIKADEKRKKIPVIILSNLSQEQDIKRAIQLGIKDFLIKSNHTPSQVVQIVKGYFQKTG